MRISDWSSDVCSSDLRDEQKGQVRPRSDMSSDEQCKTGKGRGEKADSAAREARFGRAMQSKAQRLEQRRCEPCSADRGGGEHDKIGRAHVCTPVTNAHLVCRLLLEKKKKKDYQDSDT